MNIHIGRIVALALALSASGFVFGEEAELFPAAPWQQHLLKTVIPPEGQKFPSVIQVGCGKPAPLVITIAGTSETPLTNCTAGITVGLNNTDGHWSWGYGTKLDFTRGGRQESKVTVLNSREVVSLEAYYSQPKGVKMEMPKFELFDPSGDAFLDGVPVLAPKPYSEAGFLVRDAKAMSGFARFKAEDGRVKGLKLATKVEQRNGAKFVSGHLEDISGTDRAVTLLYAIPLPEGAIVWHDDPRTSTKANPNSVTELDYTWGECCGRGLHSRWPIGAVTVGGKGLAIGIDPMVPAYYRIAVNPKLRMLFIAYDLGIAVPERNYADVALCVYEFPAAEGFRGAWEQYRRLYPEAYASRVKKHGSWVAFEPLSKLKGDISDFHFRFNEYMWDPDFDDRHDVLSLRYMEPCTWWMKLKNKKGGLPSYNECLAYAEEQLKAGLPDAKAWKSSVFKDCFGRPAGSILDKPWCFGIAWSMNAAPGIKGEVTEYTLKQSEKEFIANYGTKEYPLGRDGEYIDSSELACTVAADYDRNHFSGMKAPLTFSTDEYRPVVFKGLSVWDYSQDLSRRLRARNRVLFANATPNHWSYLTPVMDAVGIEIGWGNGGKWQPDGQAQLLYWCAASGDKPYCFLMSNNKNFTYEMTEKFFKLSLAYGLIPGFQPNYFFDGDNRHERDRAIWKKYMPIVCLVSEAGWRAVNRLAKSMTPGVVVEQFGEKYLTAYNYGKNSTKAQFQFLCPKVASVRDLVSKQTAELAEARGTFELGAGEVAVFEFAFEH